MVGGIEFRRSNRKTVAREKKLWRSMITYVVRRNGT